MTTVATEGNRRVGAMTNTEIEQCVQDIKSWFERKSDLDMTSASPADFQRLEKAADEAVVPEGLQMLLTHLNGGIYFMEKEAMSADRIVKVLAQRSVSKLWDPMFLPFCGDEDDMLVIETGRGRVIEWDSQDGAGDEVAPSFIQYLEDYRNSLLEGNMEFIDGCGVVEKLSNAKKGK
mmetsp:Transcript_2579/g.4693  ORF Transcript_2579/g.4693 Transcript_2579/m.4693 type:complete len:177 (-) Transcript_2579:321-851(-)|eukprot:CAMPEP_0114433580 /NCGR_PEP_ID=MMETSP0103-20121206/11767_1 /TAXON_ID=37642 ORGANISM="Paraphysomonas imperforata, Strain PA2" /NCGR_SAMPLE_ID=MMETSP0103 /ASSEMBLY_ACC=CAM_ASM_000201 /LENGTH=176 /DNA_ID=CAMNT_0001603337 /DNA_START=21 /DNA_END=551 /DNA_ORIENTATION=-